MSTPAEWQIACEECMPTVGSLVYVGTFDTTLRPMVGRYAAGTVFVNDPLRAGVVFEKKLEGGDLFVELPER
jgi:hypothetical protein